MYNPVKSNTITCNRSHLFKPKSSLQNTADVRAKSIMIVENIFLVLSFININPKLIMATNF